MRMSRELSLRVVVCLVLRRRRGRRPSTISTSGCAPAAMRSHWRQRWHGGSAPVQLRACANCSAVSVFPVCFGPTKRYACATRPVAIAPESALTAGCCPAMVQVT